MPASTPLRHRHAKYVEWGERRSIAGRYWQRNIAALQNEMEFQMRQNPR
jgi:hypothetical protein